MAGAKGRSGGPRPNSGGARPNSGPKPREVVLADTEGMDPLSFLLLVQNSGDVCLAFNYAEFSQTRIEVNLEPLTKVGGIAFPSKETVSVGGKKSGEVSYDRIQLNPDIPAGLFDFPSF